MFDFIFRLAGSKVASWIGGALAVLSALCQLEHQSFVDLLGVHGLRFCALMAISGAFLAVTGRSVMDRRNQADPRVDDRAMAAGPGGVVQPHRRRKA